MEPIETSRSRTGSAFSLTFALLAAAFGFLALLGWVLGLSWLASFGADLMPMAPSTAVLFLLFGTAISLGTRTPLSRRCFWISVAAGCFGALAALLLFVLACLNVHWAVERLGLNITGTVGGAPMGHISPVAAFCFLLASVSFLASLSQSVVRRWRTALALGSAGVLLGTCSILLLAYLYGTPLLYGGTFIPPALNTILAFMLLGLALLVSAAHSSRSHGGQSEDIPATSYVFLLPFVLLAAGIVAAGYFYYRHNERHYRAEVERQLSAIAELKVSELAQWRKERLADGATFFKNPSFAALVRRFLTQPADTDTRRQLLDWLGNYPTFNDYDQFRLMDAQGVTRLSRPDGLNPASSDTLRVAAEVLRSGRITLQDFYRHERDHRVYLQVMVPILDELDASRPLGVLELRLDPAIYLYPLLKRWPTPSRTAEILLVRRDGSEAVFLNELRFRTNTALNLRTSLDDITLPAAQAALGREGVMDGIDYRGVPVVAALRAIPDSPWALVARMDTAEVYAPMRERLWQVAGMIAVLLFGAGASAGLVWRRQRVQFYREKAAAAETIRETKDYLENLINHANAPIIVWNPQFRITRFNHAFESLTGRKAGDMIGGPLEVLFPINQVASSMELIKKTMGGERWETVEIAILHTDGSVRSVLWNSATIFAADGKTPVAAIAQGQDITERKRAEEALRASEQEFRSLAEAMPQIVWVTRPDGWNIYFNQQWMDYTGLTLEESYGHGWNTPFHPDDRQRAWDAWQRATQHGDPYAIECRLRRADGAYHWWLIRGVPQRNASGEILKWFGTCTDIENIKQAEELLRDSEVRYRRLFETTKDGVLILDAVTGMVVDVNPFLIELLGFSHQEFLGKKVWELGFFKDIVANQDNFVELQQKEYIRYEDKPLEASDGRRIEVEFTSNVYLVNHQKVIQCNIRDISERKAAEEKRRVSEIRYRRLFETAKDGILILDAVTGMVVDVNPFLIELLGFSHQEFLGKKVWELGFFKDIVANQDNFAELQQKEYVRYEDLALETSDGRRIEVEFVSNVYLVNHQKVIQCNIRDITDRKRAEALQQSARELQEKNAELERFLYTASHDLKSPVVTVRTFLGYLEQDMAAADAGRIEKDMHFVRAATDKMVRLLDELLELSRIGLVVNPPVRVTLRNLVDETLGTVAGRIAERGVTMKVGEHDVTLCGDRLRLAEIWQNLVENAVKFMGGQKEPRVEIGAETRGAETVFFVRDNGSGIDPRYHTKVFGLFEKLDPKTEGTGIGLALVKRIVEMYRGRIWLESPGLGQGAGFYFTLPAAVNNPKEGEKT